MIVKNDKDLTAAVLATMNIAASWYTFSYSFAAGSSESQPLDC